MQSMKLFIFSHAPKMSVESILMCPFSFMTLEICMFSPLLHNQSRQMFINFIDFFHKIRFLIYLFRLLLISILLLAIFILLYPSPTCFGFYFYFFIQHLSIETQITHFRPDYFPIQAFKTIHFTPSIVLIYLPNFDKICF